MSIQRSPGLVSNSRAGVERFGKCEMCIKLQVNGVMTRIIVTARMKL